MKVVGSKKDVKSFWPELRQGYWRVAMKTTMRNDSASWSKAWKVFLVQIVFCNSKTWRRNR
jgi:hypothetical protein